MPRLLTQFFDGTINGMAELIATKFVKATAEQDDEDEANSACCATTQQGNR